MTADGVGASRLGAEVRALGERRAGGRSFTRVRVGGRASRIRRLNQAELLFSIVQRKALTPNDFGSVDALADRLRAFGAYYRQVARPFEWTFTRHDLNRVLARIADREPHLQLAA